MKYPLCFSLTSPLLIFGRSILRHQGFEPPEVDTNGKMGHLDWWDASHKAACSLGWSQNLMRNLVVLVVVLRKIKKAMMAITSVTTWSCCEDRSEHSQMFSCKHVGNLCVAGLGRVLKFLSAPAELGFCSSAGWACAGSSLYSAAWEACWAQKGRGHTWGTACRGLEIQWKIQQISLVTKKLRPTPLASLQVNE